jgi:peptidoglycan hydrolase-like protein with peptidoglycan-binding domain
MKKAFLALAVATALATASPAFAAASNSSAQHALYVAVQTKLKADHLYNGPINGVWTDATREALTLFQERHRLAQTGRLDSPTKRALGV